MCLAVSGSNKEMWALFCIYIMTTIYLFLTLLDNAPCNWVLAFTMFNFYSGHLVAEKM